MESRKDLRAGLSGTEESRNEIEAAIRSRSEMPLDPGNLGGMELIESTKSRIVAATEGEMLYARGLDLAMRAEYESALGLFSKALEFEPELGDALFMKGALLHSQGEESQALELIEKSMEKTSRKEEAWYIKGEILSGMGFSAEARNCFEHVLSINPANEHAKEKFEKLS